MDEMTAVTSTTLVEHKKISMGISELAVFIFCAIATLAFVRISFAVNNSAVLTIISFAILFLIMWAVALRTGHYWVIAFSGILLALNPAKAGVGGMGLGSLWLYSSFCVFIFTEKSGKVLSAVNWKILGMFVFPALFSFLFYAQEDVSLSTEGIRLLDILAPIVIGPVFFTLTLRNSKERLLGIIVMMFSVLILYFAIVSLGVPRISEEDLGIGGSGFATTYLLWGQAINMVRTQTGIILSIICAASFVLVIEKKGSFVPYISFIAGLLGIFWGRGRGAFVSLVIAICIYMLMNLRRVGNYMVSIFVVGALLAGALTFSPQVSTAYNKWLSRWNLSGGETLDSGRVGIWVRAIEQIEREPFGVGRWTMIVKRGHIQFNAHNDFFCFAVSYGIFVSFAYAFVMMYAFYSLYRASKKNADPLERAIAGATLSAVFCLAINSLTDHLIADSGRYLLAWFIVGVGWSIADKNCRRIAENYI